MSSASTSKPRFFADVDNAQSSSSNSALPHPAPHRTLSGPSILQTTSINSILGEQITSPSSSSPTLKPQKNLRFAKDDDVLKKTKTTPVFSKGSNREGINRRHSADPKMNVYTKCGRNSDDWLFGGWNVADTVKKMWEKEPEAKLPREKKN